MTERESFEHWLDNLDKGKIPEFGYESLEVDMAYLAWQAAYQQGRKDQKEQDAKLCEELPSVYDAVMCAEAIRGQE